MNKENKIQSFSYIPILIMSALIVILVSCVLSPLYMQIRNDVTLMYTILPSAIEYLIIVLECCYIALLFSVVSCSVYFSKKSIGSFRISMIICISLIFFKHILNLAVSSIIDGYIDLSFDIPVTLISAIIDTLQVTIVAFFANYKCSAHFERARKMQKATKYLNAIEFDEFAEVYPFGKFYNLKNIILYPIFIGSIVSSLILIFQRIYADIIVLGSLQSSFELVDLVLSYSSDLFLQRPIL